MNENKEETKTNVDNESDHEKKVSTLVTDIIINNYDKMDINNKVVSDVILQKGIDAGRDFMLSSVDFDYSAMRSKYG